MFQTKEQDKTWEQLNEVEKGNLPENEFTVMIVNMIPDNRKKKKMEAQTKKIQDIFNKEFEDIKI